MGNVRKMFRHKNLTDTIRLFTDINLDFADCYLLARAKRENVDLETFDSLLHKKFVNSVQ